MAIQKRANQGIATDELLKKLVRLEFSARKIKKQKINGQQLVNELLSTTEIIKMTRRKLF